MSKVGKIDQYRELRKVFADVLLAHDCELIDKANKAVAILRNNPNLLVKYPLIHED